MEKEITCIYHKDCVDGTMAAAVVLRKYPHAQLFPLAHNYAEEEIETILDNTNKHAHIYIVDTTVGLGSALARGYGVTVIDHHVSEHARMEEVARTHSALTYVFDNEKSGASLSWSYLFPNEVVPDIVRHVEDNDLWKKKFGEQTEHVVNHLSLYNNDPHHVLTLIDVPLMDIVSRGLLLTEYVHGVVGRSILAEPVTLRIGTHDVLAYNITDHQSACGNALSLENECAVVLYTILGNTVRMSFRSHDAHEPSALKLAMTVGGGGHRNASGATVPLGAFLESIVR